MTVLPVEIRHLIRLTGILLHQEHCGEGEKSVRKSCQVVIAAGSHLFPFRTEKLSPVAPMVLQCNAGE